MASILSTNNSILTNGLLTLNLNQQQTPSPQPTTTTTTTTTTSSNNIYLIAKFDYKSKEANELDLKKNERLLLIDNSKNWWLVKKVENEQTGYVPSNYVKKEKKSLLEKIIPRKFHANSNSSEQIKSQLSPVTNHTNSSTNSNPSRAIVKHKYTASKPDELTLNTGVRVLVLEKFGDGWWKVAVDDANNDNKNKPQIGLYPFNYLIEESNVIRTNTIKNSPSNEKQFDSPNQTISPKSSNLDNSNPNLDSSYPKCESISSTEKDIEYLRVIYPFKSLNSNHNSFNNELSVDVNEIVKLVEDDSECLDYDKSWIKVFNSQGLTGMIPSKCVQPILDYQLNDFVFIRRPTCVGLLANNQWYFGNITRFETILLLNKYANNGDYLVRDSDNGDFSISLKSENINNKHFKVHFKDNKFLIGKKLFNSMQDLLDHYHKNPIFDQNGEKLYLMKPFNPPKFDALFSKLS